MTRSTIFRRPTGRLAAAALAGFALVLACDDGPSGPDTRQPNAAQSTITVSQREVPSGETARITLTTRDSTGRRLSRGGATVTFRASRGSSTGTLSQAWDHLDGTYSATYTGDLAGTPLEIGATVNGDTVSTLPPTISVVPGEYSHANSPVSVLPRTIDVGETATITLRLRDAAGNHVPRKGRQVAFTASGGTSAGTLSAATDRRDGSYTATFRATSAGTPLAIGATIDGQPVTSPPPKLSVSVGLSLVASELNISVDTISVGAAANLTLVLMDSAGFVRDRGGSQVVFTVTSGAGVSDGTFSPVTDHGNGSYTTNFTGTVAGTAAAIGATVDGVPVPPPLPTVTVVESITASPQNSEVTVSADSVAAGSSVTVYLVTRSPDGTPLTTGRHTVSFTASGGGSTGVIGPTVDHGDGSYSTSFTGQLAGSPATISAVLDGGEVQMLDSVLVSHLPTVRVVPGPARADSSLLSASPAAVPLGATATLRVQARDSLGNRLTSGGRVVSFSRRGAAGGSAGRIDPTVDLGDGRYQATYTADSAGAPDTVSAALDGVALPGHGVTVTVICTAGPISLAMSEITVNDSTSARRPVKAVVLSSGRATTITLVGRDTRGCPTTAPATVVFGTSGGTSTGSISPVPATQQGDGRFTATFMADRAGTPTTITATIDGAPVLSSLPTVTVVPGDISAMTSTVVVSSSQIDSGAVATVTLTAHDAAGNRILTGGRQVVFVTSDGSTTGTVGPTLDLGDGRYTASFVGTGVGRTTSIEALVDGTPLPPPFPTITVVAGTISPAHSVIRLSHAVIAVGDTATVTLEGYDALGRRMVGGGHIVVFALTTGTGQAVITPVPAYDGNNGTYLAWIVGGATGSPVTVTATIDGKPVTSPSPTLTIQ